MFARDARTNVILSRLQAAAVRRHTRMTLRNVADCLLRDVLLPDGMSGQVGVDVLLLRDLRLYVLDILRADGAIFAGNKMDRWTVIGRQQRFGFNNPLHRLQDQVFALRALVPEFTLEPRVVFAGHGHFPKGRPDGVQLLEEFAQPLRRPRKHKSAILPADVKAAWARLREAAGVPAGKEVPAPRNPSPDAPVT